MPGLRNAFVAIFMACATLLPGGCAQTTTEAASPGKIVELLIPAPSLEGNLLDDPTVQPLSVYLPPGYDASSDQHYPVLYLLHGFTGTNRTWLIDPQSAPDEPSPDGNYGRAGFLESPRLDAIIEAGIIPDLIIVAPNGRNAYKHSFYVNSPVTGNWEDYIVKDVVGYVDANYRTLPTAASRGVAGHSGGGNGALFMAMRHSDVFGSVYAMAPCCLGPTFSLPSASVLAAGGELNAFWQEVFTRVNALTSVDELPAAFTDRTEDFWVNTQLASAAAYLPNPNKPPLYADFLYETRDGQLVRNEDAAMRRRMLANYYLLDQHKDDLRALRGILIDYGEFEMMPLTDGNSKFFHALAERRIPFILEVYKGGDHGNMVAERLETRGLVFFAETLEFSSD